MCYAAITMKAFLPLVLFVFHVSSAHAQGGRSLTVNLGSKIDFWGLIGNVLSFLAASALYIAPVVFLAGVLQYTMGGVDSGRADSGKKLMKAAVIGFAVIIGSYSILRVLYYFLQG